MGQITLFVGALNAINPGTSVLDSVTQGDGNSAPNQLDVILDVTAFTGTSVLPSILLVDPVSQKKVLYNAPAFATITGTGTFVYVIGPPGLTTVVTGSGLTAAVNLPAPSLWAVRLNFTAVTNFTATCTAYTVPLLN